MYYNFILILSIKINKRSATSLKWIEVKMNEIGVSRHQDYKIVFYLDCAAMISVYTAEYGLLNVKPLKVIW